MYKRVKTKKLGRTVSHRKALILNQLRSLVESGSIKTTTPKAKVVKNEIESLIAKVKNTKDGDLSLRRRLQVVLGSSDLVKRFMQAAKDNSVSVTLKKVGFRDGDNSEVSLVEVKGLKVKKAKSTRKKEVEKKEVEIEEKKVPIQEEPKKRGILNLGKKTVKEAAPIKKERAKSRSGL